MKIDEMTKIIFFENIKNQNKFLYQNRKTWKIKNKKDICFLLEILFIRENHKAPNAWTMT